MASRVNWRGDELKRKLARAAMLAVDATMSAAIIHAKSGHGAGAHGAGRFVTQSGELERGTRIVQKAKLTRTGVVGRWGVRGVVYARRIELGFQGKDRLGRVIPTRPFPYLRPAAEKEYPNLRSRMRRAFARA